jgi:hypothetical protein
MDWNKVVHDINVHDVKFCSHWVSINIREMDYDLTDCEFALLHALYISLESRRDPKFKALLEGRITEQQFLDKKYKIRDF